jgi:hypothetical protein
MFYVYEHIRPDTNKVFYVGKGSGYRSGITQHRNNYWKNIVAFIVGWMLRPTWELFLKPILKAIQELKAELDSLKSKLGV